MIDEYKTILKAPGMVLYKRSPNKRRSRCLITSYKEKTILIPE